MSRELMSADATTSMNYLNHDRSIKSWLLTLDHKRIGILYLVVISLVFLGAGILALFIRLTIIGLRPHLKLDPRFAGDLDELNAKLLGSIKRDRLEDQQHTSRG